MKSHRITTINGGVCIVHTPDDVVGLKVGDRTYTLEYCSSLGPSFYFKNGKPYHPSQYAPIWKVFKEWLDSQPQRAVGM